MLSLETGLGRAGIIGVASIVILAGSSLNARATRWGATLNNLTSVAKIAAIMEGEGDYFIAVGAGHLVGEDSVVDLLGERGFTVERVQ